MSDGRLRCTMFWFAFASACAGPARESPTLASAPPASEAPASSEPEPDASASPSPSSVAPSDAADAAATPSAPLRVIDAVAAPAMPRVPIELDGVRVATVAFRADVMVSGAPGAHEVAVGDPPLASATASLSVDPTSVAIAFGMPPAERVGVVIAPAARFRFFHALSGVGRLDVCAVSTSGTRAPIFDDVAYGAFSVAADAQIDEALEFRLHGRAPCRGERIGVARLHAGSNAPVTFVATGNVGRPAVARILLVCADHAACEYVGIDPH